jgi:HlyD family secretion protein
MKRLLLAFIFFGLIASCNSNLQIGAVKVHRGAVENIVASTTSGTVKAKSHSILSFGMPGRMSVTFVNEGDPVKKGMVLAELENSDLKAINEQNRKEVSRFESLSKAKLTSNFNLDTAKKNFEVSNTELERTMIRAPYDGLITDVNLNIGQFYNTVVDEGRPPMRIIDRENRRVEGQIDEVDITKVKIGARRRST